MTRWTFRASPSCSAPGAPSVTPFTPVSSVRSATSSAGMPVGPISSSGRRPARSWRPCCAPVCRPPTSPAGPAASRSRRQGAAVVARAGLGPPRRREPRRSRVGAMASPSRVARAFRAPWEVRPGSLAAAMLPAGRIPTDPIAAPFDALYGDQWPSRPLWIVAVDLDTGRRTVFGRPGAPRATPAEAVQASCAIPAYFEPVEIDGARYVDGGVHSTTNADVVAPERPDLVLISAPMSAVRGAARMGLSLAHPPDRPAVARPGGRRPPPAGDRGDHVPAHRGGPRGDERRRPRPGEVGAGQRAGDRDGPPAPVPRRRPGAARPAHSTLSSSPIGERPAADHERTNTEEPVALAVDRAQDVEVAVDAVGLGSRRHHAPVDALDDVELGRPDRDPAARRVRPRPRRSRRWPGTGARPTRPSRRPRGARSASARSRGTCRRVRPTAPTPTCPRPRSRRRSRSGRGWRARPVAARRDAPTRRTARRRTVATDPSGSSIETPSAAVEVGVGEQQRRLPPPGQGEPGRRVDDGPLAVAGDAQLVDRRRVELLALHRLDRIAKEADDTHHSILSGRPASAGHTARRAVLNVPLDAPEPGQPARRACAAVPDTDVLSLGPIEATGRSPDRSADYYGRPGSGLTTTVRSGSGLSSSLVDRSEYEHPCGLIVARQLVDRRAAAARRAILAARAASRPMGVRTAPSGTTPRVQVGQMVPVVDRAAAECAALRGIARRLARTKQQDLAKPTSRSTSKCTHGVEVTLRRISWSRRHGATPHPASHAAQTSRVGVDGPGATGDGSATPAQTSRPVRPGTHIDLRRLLTSGPPSGWWDLNPRPPDPQSGALTKLRYSP